MNSTTVTFWKPSLLISAEPSGLFVAVRASAPSAATKPAEKQPSSPRPN
jgi:hypothetical protein